jgi:hypothetical protein
MTDDQRSWQAARSVPPPGYLPPPAEPQGYAYPPTAGPGYGYPPPTGQGYGYPPPTGPGYAYPPTAGPGYGYPPPTGPALQEPPRPDQLRLIAGLLVLNLTLSILVTVVSLFARHSIVEYQLDHRGITDPALRQALQASYKAAIIVRAVGNVIASVVYLFLVRALFRGRRWAYRRVIWLGAGGSLALLLAQTTPYPPLLRVEQLTQAVVLAVLVYVVTRPAVRAHFASGLPGRDVRRFRK